MSNLIDRMRQRSASARRSRAIERALRSAPRAVRDELLQISTRH